MIQNPILKVLFTFQKFGVESLLIGGQACIIYGAAEFSRDSDFVIFCDTDNLKRLKKALRTLKARNIYVPPLKKKFLNRGHACHFRCYVDAAKNIRIDILAKLRSCDDFDKLWQRRFTVRLPDKKTIEVIGLEDLVQSKKTQRDKDWLMLNRLIENDMLLTHRPNVEKIKWWLCECRNSKALMKLVNKNRKLTQECVARRPFLKTALKNNVRKLEKSIAQEELLERRRDHVYWQPLRKELEILRRTKH